MADYTLTHTYESGCPVAIVKAVAGDQIAMARVDLTGCPDELTASIAADPDDDTGRTVILTWDNAGEGPVDIQWDDEEPTTGNPESGTRSRTFDASEDGPHTVIVTDSDDVTRRVVVQFDIPADAGDDCLQLRVEADPSDPTGYTARAVWDATDCGDGGDMNAQVEADPSDPTGYTARVTWSVNNDGGGTP